MSQEAPFPQIEYIEFDITLDMSSSSKNVKKNSSLMFTIHRNPLKALNDLKNGVYSDDYINYQNEYGWTILHYLCRNAAKIPYAHDLIEFLLNHPIIDVNLKNGSNRHHSTPLMLACRNLHTDSDEKTVEMLLKHKNIIVDQRFDFNDIYNWTVLMIICYFFSINGIGEKSIELLLQHPKTDVNIQNGEYKTALMYICDKERQSVINIKSVDKIITMFLNHPNFNDELHAKTVLKYKNWSLKDIDSLFAKI